MFSLSVGDYWRYAKFTAYTDAPSLVEFRVESKKVIGGRKCLVIGWREAFYNRETGEAVGITHGKYVVDSETERFIGAFRVTYSEEAGVGMFEHFSPEDVEFWGVKGLARLVKPLNVGEEWGVERGGKAFRARVSGVEEVKTYAGSFRCYLIETRGYEGDRVVCQFRSWYSEELGIIVRSEAYDEDGDLVGLVELVEYRFKCL